MYIKIRGTLLWRYLGKADGDEICGNIGYSFKLYGARKCAVRHRGYAPFGRGR